MQFSALLSIKIICILLGTCISSCSITEQNPFLTQGKNTPDGQLGSFSQNDTGDCFFLASLIAIAQDDEGKKLIESSLFKFAKQDRWQITFPNMTSQTITVTETEINEYQLANSDGDGFSRPVKGDPDVRILEIAADKFWKKLVKPEGLWDDVPMNVIFMFSNAKQVLIWNPNKASKAHSEDIEKYKRVPKGVIKEIEVSTEAEVATLLKNIIIADHDGISMILIDYLNYHAVAIDQIDFSNNTYTYIDTYSNTRHTKGLGKLFHGMANGLYAINYLEVGGSDLSTKINY